MEEDVLIVGDRMGPAVIEMLSVYVHTAFLFLWSGHLKYNLLRSDFAWELCFCDTGVEPRALCMEASVLPLTTTSWLIHIQFW